MKTILALATALFCSHAAAQTIINHGGHHRDQQYVSTAEQAAIYIGTNEVVFFEHCTFSGPGTAVFLLSELPRVHFIDCIGYGNNTTYPFLESLFAPTEIQFKNCQLMYWPQLVQQAPAD